MQIPDRLYKRVRSGSEMDTVKQRSKKLSNKNTDLPLLEFFRDLWWNGDTFRNQRARAFRFAYDDQWGDLMEYNGETMTMRKYLQQTGNIVLQSNQVQNKVETMCGVLVKEALEPICTAVDDEEQQFGEVVTKGLQVNCDKNKLSELYIDWGRELCLGGLMVGYETWDACSGPDGTFDSWTSYVNPNMFIFDSQMSDSRFLDATHLGRQIKMSFGEIVAKFAHSPEDYAILRAIYHDQAQVFQESALRDYQDKYKDSMMEFMKDTDPSTCMVLEAWTKETRARIRLHDTNSGTEDIIDYDDVQARRETKRENQRRREEGRKAGWSESEIPYIEGDGYGDEESKNGFFIDEFWYCRFLAPDGTILWEGESPLPARNHPFVVRAIPMCDGKIQGYLYPEIDHNIIMNRAIILNDFLQRSGAKGVPVVPKQILGGVDPHDFARSWASLDDMVFVDLKPGMENMMPKVFYGPAPTFDISRFLQTFTQMGDKSTAITDALQGKTPFAGASGNLYAQMSNNSTTAIAAYLLKIHSFVEDLHFKKMTNLLYFYDTERWEKIAGMLDNVFDGVNLNLDDLRYIHFDIKINESTDTPAHRELAEQDAKEFVMNGLITMDEYMLVSKRPWMMKLKQYRDSRMQEMQDAQQGGMMSDGMTNTPEQIPLGAMQQTPQQQMSQTAKFGIGQPQQVSPGQTKKI